MEELTLKGITQVSTISNAFLCCVIKNREISNPFLNQISSPTVDQIYHSLTFPVLVLVSSCKPYLFLYSTVEIA